MRNTEGNTRIAFFLRERALLTLSAVTTITVLGWLLWYCRYGIDFTDESFYLVWMSDPFIYKLSASQFGFIYHPLYDMLGGNIALVRRANMLITVALAWGMAVLFLKDVFGETSLKPLSRSVIAGSLATSVTCSLLFSGMWLSTPSYNSLNLQSLLLTAIGLIMAKKHGGKSGLAGWLLIGLGCWGAFMAKPTTAGVLGVLAAFYLIVSGKFNVRLALLSIFAVLLLLVISAFAIDGSVMAFFRRLQGAVATSSLLDAGTENAPLFRLDDFSLGQQGNKFLVALTLTFFAVAYLLQARKAALAITGSWMAILFGLACFVIISGLYEPSLAIGPFQVLLLASVPFAAVLFAFFTCLSNDLAAITRQHWALALILLLLPYAYAFGSGNNYWVMAAGAGIFWVLGGFVLLRPLASKPELAIVTVSLSLAAQLVTVVLLQAGTEKPYRQPQALHLNDFEIEIGRPGSRLLLSKGFGQYVADAVDVARKAGFRTGTPMIDLSGRSPGILYALGASNIGQAWTLGGYPGSGRLVVAMLKHVPCEDLARAWVLVEPQGLGKISPEVLSSFGGNPATDFEVVGSFLTARGAGSHQVINEQRIWKPMRPVDIAAEACVITRNGSQ